jgi:hypothetical protein
MGDSLGKAILFVTSHAHLALKDVGWFVTSVVFGGTDVRVDQPLDADRWCRTLPGARLHLPPPSRRPHFPASFRPPKRLVPAPGYDSAQPRLPDPAAVFSFWSNRKLRAASLPPRLAHLRIIRPGGDGRKFKPCSCMFPTVQLSAIALAPCNLGCTVLCR